MIRVSHLYTYPIKSSQAIAHTTSILQARGFQHDRRMALIDSDGKIMTGRDYPQILKLSVTTQLAEYKIDIESEGGSQSIVLSESDFSSVISPVDLWAKEQHPARIASEKINQWFSEKLQVPCRLVYMDDNCQRNAQSNRQTNFQSQPGDEVSYADDYPVLLTSSESLADLNSKLDTPVSNLSFRPNIVIEGLEAFAEETFKTLTIGECEFEVAQACPRCVFTTIDPSTGIKRGDQEPLRTLASYRNRKGFGVLFGIQIVPRKLGAISIGDEVTFY